MRIVCTFFGCLTSLQHDSVSLGRICTQNFTCCHTEIEVPDPTFYLTQSQYTDTEPTSPSADPIMPGPWQGSHWSANFISHWYDSTRKKKQTKKSNKNKQTTTTKSRKRDSTPGSSAPEADALTTKPARRLCLGNVMETGQQTRRSYSHQLTAAKVTHLFRQQSVDVQVNMNRQQGLPTLYILKEKSNLPGSIFPFKFYFDKPNDMYNRTT